MMTEDDDLIRAQDIPERMQLANSTLSSSTSLSLHAPLSVDALNDAAMWITQRLSVRKTRDFFSPDGEHQHLKAHLVMAVTYVVKALFIEYLEVPYIWTHKRDNISHFDVTDMRSRFELLSQAELWRIYVLGQKYCSLRTRLAALQASYNRLQVEDKYFDEDIIPETNNVEMIADASEWLVMKYKAKKPNDFELSFNDEEEIDVKKPKMPSRISAYEVTKKSIVSKLAQVSSSAFPCDVVIDAH
jgi:transcription elongation factor SPT6